MLAYVCVFDRESVCVCVSVLVCMAVGVFVTERELLHLPFQRTVCLRFTRSFYKIIINIQNHPKIKMR